LLVAVVLPNGYIAWATNWGRIPAVVAAPSCPRHYNWRFLMFRTLTAFVLGLAAIAFVSAPAIAEEKEKDAKEVTLEGTITCPKCDLGDSDKCFTVIKVKDKIYWFDADSNKKYHGDICKAGKDGKVTGKVKKDGDKMVITVTKLEFKK
jgi:hypothetical protein